MNEVQIQEGWIDVMVQITDLIEAQYGQEPKLIKIHKKKNPDEKNKDGIWAVEIEADGEIKNKDAKAETVIEDIDMKVKHRREGEKIAR